MWTLTDIIWAYMVLSVGSLALSTIFYLFIVDRLTRSKGD